MPTRSATDVVEMIRKTLWPAYAAEKERLDRIDRWYRWDHDNPHQPRQSTREYKELQSRAQTPWLRLVVTSVAQALFVDGYRRADDPENAEAWTTWQTNNLDARQIAVHKAALAYGLSYVTVLPGKDPLTSTPTPVMRGVSPRRMITFYLDPAEDDWPAFALRVEPAKVDSKLGFALRFYDEQDVHYLQADAEMRKLDHVEAREHGLNVCPVVRFANDLDLEGRADGEVEPFIPVAGRIDQTVFDRLVVQRFASWVVRTIAGMSPPESLESDSDSEQAWRASEKLRLRAEDILVSDDPDTKFGSLPASDMSGFISAVEADIKALAAVSQTPAHELLGTMANLSAEALAAARASLTAKVDERKTSFGESWEQALRLARWVDGDAEGARDAAAQVRWRDTEIRSLAQAADALGKLAQMLGVPVELLWEKVPGFTQQDIDRAKVLVEQGGGMDALLRELEDGQTSPSGEPGGGNT